MAGVRMGVLTTAKLYELIPGDGNLPSGALADHLVEAGLLTAEQRDAVTRFAGSDGSTPGPMGVGDSLISFGGSLAPIAGDTLIEARDKPDLPDDLRGVPEIAGRYQAEQDGMELGRGGGVACCSPSIHSWGERSPSRS